jgi:hypothetical protein
VCHRSSSLSAIQPRTTVSVRQTRLSFETVQAIELRFRRHGIDWKLSRRLCGLGQGAFDLLQGKSILPRPRRTAMGGTAGGPGLESVNAVARDPAGAVFLAGFYTGASNLGGAPLVLGGQNDVFLAQYGPDGQPLWAKGTGGTGNEQANALSVDPVTGSVWMAGDFDSASLAFDDATVSLQGTSSAFITKYLTTGKVQWATGLGGSQSVTARDLALLPSGPVLVTGSFVGTVNFNSSAETASTESLFVERLLANGNLDALLVKGTCATGAIQGEGIGLDSAGNLLLAGHYQGTCNLSGTDLPPSTSGAPPGLFAAKFDSGGNLLWVSSQPDAGLFAAVRMSIDNKDNLVLATGFRGSIGLSDGSSMESRSRTSSDVLLMKLTRDNGSVSWTAGPGGPGEDQGLGATVDLDNSVWATGFYSGPSASFENVGLNGLGGTNVFIAHLSEAGQLLRPFRMAVIPRKQGRGWWWSGPTRRSSSSPESSMALSTSAAGPWSRRGPTFFSLGWASHEPWPRRLLMHDRLGQKAELQLISRGRGDGSGEGLAKVRGQRNAAVVDRGKTHPLAQRQQGRRRQSRACIRRSIVLAAASASGDGDGQTA